MNLASLRRTLCLLAWPLLAVSQPGTAAQADDDTITLLTLNQPPCLVPTQQTVIKAKLAYHIAAAEQSDYGFAVSIKFQSTTPGHTYSRGRLATQAVTRKSDTLTIAYPMSAVLTDARLGRPITCYFYLHRNTAPGHSHVIAKTPPIIFKECL